MVIPLSRLEVLKLDTTALLTVFAKNRFELGQTGSRSQQNSLARGQNKVGSLVGDRADAGLIEYIHLKPNPTAQGVDIVLAVQHFGLAANAVWRVGRGQCSAAT